MLIDYITNIYNEEDDNNTWFNKIKEFVGKYNFASEVKEYKKNPDIYIGHVGDFCEMLRVAVTTLSNTPNLYDILSILGKEEIEKRIKMQLTNEQKIDKIKQLKKEFFIIDTSNNPKENEYEELLKKEGLYE